MKVSIVIDNYNYGRFLGAAIESALAQSWPNSEVIVVDDGSTDDSRDVMARYKRSITAVYKQNGGQTSAFNAGFEASAGDVVLFLDADDQLYSSCIETVIKAWLPDAAKVQFRLNTIDAEGRNLNMPFPHFTAALQNSVLEARRQLLSVGAYSWPVSSGNVFSRGFLSKVMPICPDFRRAPDGLLNRLAPLYGPVITLPNILADYRVHGGNVLAQEGLAPEKYAANIKYEMERDRYFCRCAQVFGCHLPEGMLLQNKNHIETRLLSLRLSRSTHPVRGDRIARVMTLGIRSVFLASDISFVGRLVWVSWFILLATLPKQLIGMLVRAARLQSRRASFAKALLSWSRR